MGLGFRKSFKVAPGVRFNVSTRGVGASVGTKGLRYSVNSRGQRRTTVSIPGSGLSYSSYSSSGSKGGSSGRSYQSNAYQNQQNLLRKQKEAERLEELERNKNEVELFENKIDMIKSIHKECDEIFDWVSISEIGHEYDRNEIGSHEQEAIHKYKTFKPNFIQNVFKKGDSERTKLANKIEEAKKLDKEEYDGVVRSRNIAFKVLEKDVETFFKVIDELSPLDDLLEFGSGFEFFVEDPEILEVEFDVHSEKVVPKQMKSLTKTGKLTIKDMPKSKFYDIMQDYVCSCAIRIARDMFAILPFEAVVVHAMDEQLNTGTGHRENSSFICEV